MREPLTKSEKRDVKQYEEIVKKYIDELDPMGFFPDAPSNAYKKEIRDITLRLHLCKSWYDIAKIMYIVFAYYFTIEDANPQSQYFYPAKKIEMEMKSK